MAGTFEKIKQAYKLFKSIDFEKLDKLSRKVDLQKVMDGFSKLDDTQLKGLMKMMDGGQKSSHYRTLVLKGPRLHLIFKY